MTRFLGLRNWQKQLAFKCFLVRLRLGNWQHCRNTDLFGHDNYRQAAFAKELPQSSLQMN